MGCFTRRGLLKVCEALSLKLNLLVSFCSLGCLGVINSSSDTFSAAWEKKSHRTRVQLREEDGGESGVGRRRGIGQKWERVTMPGVLAPIASNFSPSVPVPGELPLKPPPTAAVGRGGRESHIMLYLRCRHVCLTPSFSFCLLRLFFFFKDFCF